jgi:enoyl-CoA hydratase
VTGAEDRELTVTTADGITEITLDRPARRNALDAALRTQLVDAVRAFDADPTARVAVVTGRDPAFCAGVDLDELGRTGIRFDSGPTFEQVLRATTKPLVGAVNGAAVTGGLELALSLDFLLASERARFGDTHSRVGVVAGGGLTVLLVHAVGIRMARQMSFTGALIDASTALRAGLVNEVVPHEQLLPRAREVAAQIADTGRRTGGRSTSRPTPRWLRNDRRPPADRPRRRRSQRSATPSSVGAARLPRGNRDNDCAITCSPASVRRYNRHPASAARAARIRQDGAWLPFPTRNSSTACPASWSTATTRTTTAAGWSVDWCSTGATTAEGGTTRPSPSAPSAGRTASGRPR